MSNIALFDMDGTIADYDSQLRSDLAQIRSPDDAIIGQMHGVDLPDYIENRIDLIKTQKGWWANLPPILAGLDLMRCCVDIGFSIHILTQGPKRTKSAWTEKCEWCEKFVTPIAPDYGISVTREGEGRKKGEGKGLHYGRVFVDDYAPYMQAWLDHRPRGLGLMPMSHESLRFSPRQVLRYQPGLRYGNSLGTVENHLAKFREQHPDLLQALEHAYSRGDGEE